MLCIKGIVLPRSRHEPISFSWNVMSGLCCRCSSIPFLPGLGTTNQQKGGSRPSGEPSWTNIQLGHSGGEELDFFSRSFWGSKAHPWSLILIHPYFFWSFPGAGVLGGSKKMVWWGLKDRFGRSKNQGLNKNTRNKWLLVSSFSLFVPDVEIQASPNYPPLFWDIRKFSRAGLLCLGLFTCLTNFGEFSV